MFDFFHPVKRTLTAFALLVALATPCLAGSPLPIHIPEQIASKKNITLGYQDDAFPSSQQNGNILTGYSIDICNSIVSTLRTKLQLKKPRVEWVKTNSTSQSAPIKNHMADIMYILVLYSRSHHSVSELSPPFYFSNTRSVMRRNKDNDNSAELSGYSTLVKGGTIYVEQLREVNAVNDLDISIQFDTNNITAFNELRNGEYSALISNTVLFKEIVA